MKTGIELIAEERARQISSEKWTPEHDDSHIDGHLAKAAAELAAHGTDMETIDHLSMRDVWGLVRKHRANRERQLVIAGALIAAEIDRLQRNQGKNAGDQQSEAAPNASNIAGSSSATGSMLAATHQCCRCKNKHNESDRVMKRTGKGAWSSRCPRCNGESYFDLKGEASNDGAMPRRKENL